MFLLAQAGVPLTGGFVAKLGVFKAAVDVGQYPLALIAMLASVIGAFVYLRIVVTMYGTPADEAAGTAGCSSTSRRGPSSRSPRPRSIVLGVLPGFMLDFARDATLLLVGAR